MASSARRPRGVRRPGRPRTDLARGDPRRSRGFRGLPRRGARAVPGGSHRTEDRVVRRVMPASADRRCRISPADGADRVVDVTGHVVYRLDLGWEDRKVAVEYDGEEFHSTPKQLAHDERRREALESRFGWRLLAVGRGEVFGPSLALERAVGELLSLAPAIARRRW